MLLKWTTEKIVPALLGSFKGASMLHDLDLSHISSVSESLIHEPPGSPSLASPPKQRANVGRTPEAMRGASKLFDTAQNEPPIVFLKKFASTLLSTSCMISSELLAMGVSTHEDIALASVEWCEIFRHSENSLHGPLFSIFVRLAVQLNRAAGDCSLIETLLYIFNDKIPDDSAEANALKDALGQMVRSRGGVENIVSVFMKVANASQLVDNDEESISLGTPSCLSDIWDKGGTIQVMLDIIFGNPEAQISLARALVTSLSASEVALTPTVILQANCLSYIARSISGSVMTRILSDLDCEKFHESHEMQSFVKDLLEGSA
mmetsp:Transcript_27966/g.49611  ORF Transcript_27966/g.49611 Transcript_27966/m.49611 type:complete len:320 (-) Transcript_27966:1566-2525(-)